MGRLLAGLELWELLELDRLLGKRACRPAGRERAGSTCSRRWWPIACIDPGSEWRLHRAGTTAAPWGICWGKTSRIAQSDTLYRCLDQLAGAPRGAVFVTCRQRWQDLFDAPFRGAALRSDQHLLRVRSAENGQRKFGYSRDKRSDCVQVVIALIVTPDGFPLAYEVLPGNTSDKKTLADFLAKIERQYGKADRVWVMDRGIPTEETLALMRNADPPVHYLVGTPKGRSDPAGEILSRPALGGGARAGAGQAPEPDGELRPGASAGRQRQGTGDAPAPPQTAVETPP